MKNLPILLLVLTLMIVGGVSSLAGAQPLVIGITQIVEHPALDAARDGFIAALEEAGFKEGEDVVYDLQNAQGDFANAISIAQKFKDDKVDLIVAIATPTAQAALQVNREIPIVINAVTDPVAAGLAKSWESSGNNNQYHKKLKRLYQPCSGQQGLEQSFPDCIPLSQIPALILLYYL